MDVPKSDTSNLCNVCLGIFVGERPANYESWPHRRTARSLRASKDEGCPLCRLLWEKYSAGRIDLCNISIESEAFCYYYVYTQEKSRLQFYLGGSVKDAVAHAGLVEREPDDLDATIVLDPIPGKTASREESTTLQGGGNGVLQNSASQESSSDLSSLGIAGRRPLIKGWFDACTESHRRCNYYGIDLAWLPSRVLDVNSGAHGNVRLVVTAEEAVSGPYLTLSHCWGLIETIKL